jgi:hypothetical protein
MSKTSIGPYTINEAPFRYISRKMASRLNALTKHTALLLDAKHSLLNKTRFRLWLNELFSFMNEIPR